MAVLTDIDLNKKINRKDLAILPCESESITGLGYDLTIGILVPMSHHRSFSEDDENYIIPPNCYCLVITKEFVWLSENLVGTLHARGTLAARGLYTSSTNVDPNFQGQMIMSVKNLSSKAIRIKKDECFITMILHRASTPTKQLVGDEGSKKSMRVIEYLLEEVYTGKGDSDLSCKENLLRLANYYTKSNTDYGDQFVNIIHDCKSPLKRMVKSVSAFCKSRDFFGWGRTLVSVGAGSLAVYVLYDYVQIIVATKQFTLDESRVTLFAVSSLVALISNFGPKK